MPSRDAEHGHLNQSDAESEVKARSDEKLEFVAGRLLEHPVQHSFVMHQIGDHHVLEVEDLIEVLAQLGHHVPHRHGRSTFDAGDHGALGGRRHGGPQPRLILDHDSLGDFLGRVVQRALELFGQFFGIYAHEQLLRFEYRGRDRIDGNRSHLRRVPRDLPLPAEVGRDAFELDRVEDHLDGDDLREPSDEGGRERNRDVHPERLVEAEEAERCHRFAGDSVHSPPACQTGSRASGPGGVGFIAPGALRRTSSLPELAAEIGHPKRPADDARTPRALSHGDDFRSQVRLGEQDVVFVS